VIGDPEIVVQEVPMAPIEDVFAAVLPLGLDALPLGDSRVETLRIALALGATPPAIRALACALRVAREDTIALPAHRYEGLSRGKGWARRGKGPDAEWGERVGGEYRVGVGKWIVGGNDGFKRKGEDTWTVEHVRVGTQVWTVAS
jgi:hypothetical protein